MDQTVINIRQIANRLENATNSSERIETLKNLKSLVRTNPLDVGKHSLHRLIELLKEQGSSEEYQEALELISRLVKTKDKIAAASNASFILTDIMNVELLLDLLEHEDGLVGVMTSEILTEIHAIAGDSLEIAIQECPAGMNKLLQRLPDKSREEVRNQAILLVQQLTAKNEEMKKTVAFNEGFDILFGIIKSEGGASDPSVVVQDCLRICANILSGSETCQRLFYGMDGGWHLRLLEFFDPEILENIDNNNGLQSFGLEDENNDTNIPWFMQTNRLDCAVMAITALSDSQHTPIPKHQVVVGVSTQSIISCASFWISRQGPYEVVLPALQLLMNVVRDNAQVSSHVSSCTLKVTSAIKGKHIPSNIDISLSFGWRPLPSDDRRFIAIPTLLADRYVFGVPCWSAYSDGTPSEQATLAAKIRQDVSDGSLRVLDILLAADSMTSGMVMQHILAPPPPSPEDELSGALETMKPFGVVILNTLVESCSKALTMQGVVGGGSSTHSARGELDTACKCANLLTLVFIHGGLLARELSTALSTGHTSLGAGRGGPVSSALAHQPLLPFLLSTAGRCVRLQNGGYALVTALIRMLSVAGADCVRAVRQMLEDPSNLFVADLTSTSSEMSGVPQSVQIICCLFLGICFHALKGSNPNPLPTSSEPNVNKKDLSSSETPTGLTQKSMLAMIDARIGLSRFTEHLKKPLACKSSELLAQELFFTDSFHSFYESQEQIIRQSIFDYYSVGNGLNGGVSSMVSQERQIIDIQKQQILELEEKLKKSSSDPSPQVTNSSSINSTIIEEKDNEIEALKKQLAEKEKINTSLTENISSLQKTIHDMKESNDSDIEAILTATEGLKAQLEESTAHSSQLEVTIKQLESTIAQNNLLFSEMQQKLTLELEEERSTMATLNIRCQQLEQEANQSRQKMNEDSLQSANNMIAKNQELAQLRQQVTSLNSAIAKEVAETERLKSQSTDSSTALYEKISFLESQNQAIVSSAEKERSQSQQDAMAYLSKISTLQSALETSSIEFELYKSQSIVQINKLQDQLVELQSTYSTTINESDTLRISSQDIIVKLQAQIDTLEKQLKDSITESDKFKQQSQELQSDFTSKLSSLEGQLNQKEIDLKKEMMNSTGLAQQVQNLHREHKLVLNHQTTVHTQQMLFRDSEQKKLNDEIFKLKEQYLTICSEKASVDEERNKLLRRIELLEEEIRAPVESTKDKDIAISDLRDRNAELLQKLWQVESDLKEALVAVATSKTMQTQEVSPLPTPLTPPSTSIATPESYLQYFQKIIDSMTEFSDKLEIDMEEYLTELKVTINAQPITPTAFERQCDLISHCLEEAFETWSLASSSITDEVKTIRKDNFEFTSTENTLPRLIECIDVIGEVIKEKDIQLETLSTDLTTSKNNYDLKENEYENCIKDYTKEVQNNIELKDQIAQLQLKLQSQLEVLSPISEQLNPIENKLDNEELLRLQQLQMTHTQDMDTLIHQLEVTKEEKNSLTNLISIKEEQLNQANKVTAKLSSDLEKLSLQLQPLQGEIAQKDDEITSLQLQLESIQNHSLQSLATEIAQIESNFMIERNQFNEKINQLEIQITTLTTSLNDQKLLSESTIKDIHEQFEAKIRELETLISSLTTQLNEESSLNLQSTAIIAKKDIEISNLKATIEAHKAPIVASNTVIFQQLEVTKRELSELRREKEELQKKVNALKIPAVVAKRSTSITGAGSSSSSATSNNNTTTSSDNNNELERLFKDFQKLELQLKKEREGVAKAEGIIRNKTQEIEQLKSKVATLESTATATAITTIDSKDEFNSSINNGEGPGSRIWMQRQIDRLNKEVRSLREQNNELMSKMELLKSTAATTASLQAATPKPINEEISELLETVEKLRLEKANVVAQLNVERGGAQRLKKELDEARAELEMDASLRDGPIFVTSSAPGLSINLPESPAAIHHSINSVNIVQERDTLFKSNWKLREQLEAKNKEIEAVRTDVKIAEEIRHKASQLLLKEELAQSSTKILTLEAEIQELLKLHDKILSLENQCTSHLQTIETLNNTIQKKEKEWQTIDKQLTISQKECEKYYQQSEHLKSEVELQARELERLRTIIKEDEHRIHDTTKDGDAKSRELLQLKLLHDTLKQELKLTQSRLATEEMEVDRLKKIIFDKDSKLIDAVSLGDAKSKEVLSLNNTIDTLKKDVLVYQTQLATESTKIQEMRDSHTSMTSGLLVKIDSFQQQLKEKTKQCSSLTLTETELQTKVDNLTKEVITLTKKLHEEEITHSAALSNLTSQYTDQSRFTSIKVGQLEIEVVHNKAEREELQLRFDALQKRYETTAILSQQREDEIRSLQSSLRHDRMQAQSSIDMLNQAKLSSLVHISRTVLSEFDYLSQLQDQKLRTVMLQMDQKVEKMKGCVYSTGQSLKQLRGYKSQVKILQKLIKKQEDDSINSKLTVDSATRELRGLLIWLHSLRLTGPSDFISIIETDDRNYSSHAVAVKLPVYIKQARQQLESVFAAQSELIHQQRLKVREKEDAVKELETKLKYTDKDNKRGQSSALSPPTSSVHFSTSLTPRTPHTIDSLTYSTHDSSSRYSNTNNNHLLSRDNPLTYHSSSLSSRFPVTPSTPGYPTTPKVKDTTYGTTYSSGGNGSTSRRSVSAGRYGVTSSGNGYEPMDGYGSGGGGVMSPMTNELTRLHAELRKEKEKLSTLQEQHSDLLALLAQQEIEFQTIQDALYAYAGSEAVDRALTKAKQTVKSKFGSYIEFRKHSSSIKY